MTKDILGSPSCSGDTPGSLFKVYNLKGKKTTVDLNIIDLKAAEGFCLGNPA